MGLILLEALLALVVLVAIVWWTMFSGRKRGELPAEPERLCSAGSKDEPPGRCADDCGKLPPGAQ
ncbi:hypothetical protein [Comamonas composti]|uniref:hypothetical protein n=1 Tax=Comamonas composti TaxID=408558 RepID=UPI0004099E6A|nr:hypothetical protein [Comamonas composti]